ARYRGRFELLAAASLVADCLEFTGRSTVLSRGSRLERRCSRLERRPERWPLTQRHALQLAVPHLPRPARAAPCKRYRAFRFAHDEPGDAVFWRLLPGGQAPSRAERRP